MRFRLILLFGLSFFSLRAQNQLNILQEQFPDQSLVVLQKSDSIVIHSAAEIYHYHTIKEQVLHNVRPEVLNTSVSYDDFSPIQELDAYVTRTKSDGTIEKSNNVNKSYQNVMVSGIFYHDNKVIDISYPFFSIGTIATLSYKKHVTQPHFLNKFIFSSGYPTLQSKYSIYCHKSVDIGYTVFNNANLVFEKKDKGDYWLYQWEMKNIKPWKANNYREILESEPHIIPRLKSIQTNQGEQTYLKDMNAFYSWLYNFIAPLKSPNSEMDALSAEITKGLNSEIEKLKAIYDWVQDNITYVAFEDGYNGFIPRKPADVCHKKYGDCKDMGLLLYTLLQSAGIKANVVWIGSDEIPYKIEEVLSPNVFNHMIACADINGKRYWLDATAKYLDYNITSPFTQGKEGLVAIDKDNYEIVTLPITDKNINLVIDSIDLSINEKQLVGHRTYQCFGYKKLDFLFDIYKLDENSTEELSEYFSIGNDSYHQTDYKLVKNDGSRDMATIMQTDFTIDNYVRKFGNKVLINPLLIKFSQGKYFDTDKFNTRNYEYNSKREEITTLNLNGLDIQNLPDNVTIDNHLLKYTISYKKGNNQLVIHRVFEIKKYYLVKSDAEKWNESIKKINELETDNLILVGT